MPERRFKSISCEHSLHDPLPPSCTTSPPNFGRWTAASSRTLRWTVLRLREFRLALDNVRMTAWTVSELHNAREVQKNPQVVISFLTAERLRPFGQMARDLCQDLERERGSWSARAVNDLKTSLNLLRERLGTDGASK